MTRFWQFMTQERGKRRSRFIEARQVPGKKRGVALLMVMMCLAFVASVGAEPPLLTHVIVGHVIV